MQTTMVRPTAFEFATATEIVFGRGRIGELGRRARTLGQRALLVTGAEPERFPRALDSLRAAGLEWAVFCVPGEPSTRLAERGVELARAERVELVIGLGGGSALDAAKTIAGLTPNPGAPLDYLEVVGLGRALERPGLRSIRARFMRLRSATSDPAASINSARPHRPTISASLANVRNSCTLIAPGDMAAG